MNSVNFFSNIGAQSPPETARELTNSGEAPENKDVQAFPELDSYGKEDNETFDGNLKPEDGESKEHTHVEEKTPLLKIDEASTQPQTRLTIAGKISGALIGTVKFLVSAILVPGQYLVACFYDEHGRFSALLPVYKLGRMTTRRRRKKTRQAMAAAGYESEKHSQDASRSNGKKSNRILRRSPSVASTASSDSEGTDSLETIEDTDSPARHTRSKSTPAPDDEGQLPKRSIRIKVMSEDTAKQRKLRREQRPLLTAATIKSPTSPASSLGLTKYPRSPAPAPPRPLIPRRQPSYSSTIPAPTFGNSGLGQKTLIIDLDETLIHSMAKGGRMSTGHMVEVRLQGPVGMGGQIHGPQVPILYYVHKRPNCDEFLRKVSKWYNLIVFTASVQEYADPVIDWVELERKYFSKRYYRQHCTYRNGAYIKDLGQIEPDLSNVIILDNSPVSYAFHQDNAVPIEGWISDPTDNDLLHLIPLFEGLQYTTDVRSLLALRQGEPSS